MDSAQPIIVKRIKKHGHGHHGGAWKVAFADFVTAMMAFFLLMWLMGSTTPEEREAISDYFENPSAVQGPGGASTSMIKLGGVQKDMKENKDEPDSSENSDDAKKNKQSKEQVEVVKDKQRLDSLKQELEQAINASQSLKPFKDQLLLDITSEGLRIQIIDKKNRPMFDSGSSNLKSYTASILVEFGKIINHVPNKISLTGHTDATAFASRRGYTNWELSADRANASRRALVQGGLDETKIGKVVGLSSTVLFDKANPNSPVNRRISVIVLNRQAQKSLMKEGKVSVSSGQDLDAALKPSALIPPTVKKSPQAIVKQRATSNSPVNKKRPVTLLKSPGKKSSPGNTPIRKKKPIQPIRLPISTK